MFIHDISLIAKSPTNYGFENENGHIIMVLTYHNTLSSIGTLYYETFLLQYNSNQKGLSILKSHLEFIYC